MAGVPARGGAGSLPCIKLVMSGPALSPGQSTWPSGWSASVVMGGAMWSLVSSTQGSVVVPAATVVALCCEPGTCLKGGSSHTYCTLGRSWRHPGGWRMLRRLQQKGRWCLPSPSPWPSGTDHIGTQAAGNGWEGPCRSLVLVLELDPVPGFMVPYCMLEDHNFQHLPSLIMGKLALVDENSYPGV